MAALLDAAESVIAETGYEAATMSAIARRAGASIGSLYQFFPNKQAVTQALRAHYGKDYDALCAPLAVEAAAKNLPAFVSHLIDLTVSFVETHPAFLALLDAPGSTSSPAAIRNALRVRFAGFFLAARPRMSKIKADQLATVTLHMLKALAHMYAEAPARERNHFVRDFKALFSSYLGPKLGASGSRSLLKKPADGSVHAEPYQTKRIGDRVVRPLFQEAPRRSGLERSMFK